MDILNTSWKAERFFIHIFKLKNTLFGGIWPSPSWWAEAQETQQVPSRECPAQAYTQRVIHKHSMICYPTWQQLHVVALMPHPLQTSLIPPPANRAKYFKVTVLVKKKKTKKQTPDSLVWGKHKCKWWVTGQSWLKPGNPQCSHMELHVQSHMLILTEFWWVFLADMEEQPLSDASSVNLRKPVGSELANVSQPLHIYSHLR